MSSRAAAIPRTRPRLTRRAAVLGAVVMVLGATAIVPLRQYAAQRSKIAALERKIELLAGERSRLERRIRELRDPEELERIARECLGMVKPGEIAFVGVPQKGGNVPADPC